MTVASRLGAISDVATLDAILSELASNSDSRWTRAQVLYYLPDEFHDVAREYFEGDRIIAPERKPLHLEAVDRVRLHDVLATLLLPADDAAARYETEAATNPVDAEPDTSEIAPSPEEMDALPPVDDGDVIGAVLHALKQETETIDVRTPKRYRLTQGRCIGSEGEHYIYMFQWSSEPEMFVPGELRLGTLRAVARVGAQGQDEERTFQLLSHTFLGTHVARATFVVDPTFLNRTLYGKLRPWREDVASASGLAADLFKKPDPFPRADVALYDGLNAAQSEAVAVASTCRRSYVWGPPGTGKTTSLGHLIRHLADDGKRVLVLSPYNKAVDAAVIAAHNCGRWNTRDVVRFGRIDGEVRQRRIDLDSHLEEHAHRSGLLATARQLHASVMAEFAHIDRPTPGTVRKCLESLGEAVIAADRGGDTGTVTEIKSAIRALRRAFRAPERSILADARVVGTTVALSMMADVFNKGIFDHVIVDEASVLRVPEALLIALSSRSNLSFFGDPKQLPSIVAHHSPECDRWLKRNPFDLAEIRSPADATGACVLLSVQYRMAPPIRELISSLFYDGALEDGTVPQDGRVMFIDTSKTAARTTTKWIKMSQSKENMVHRGIVAGLMNAIRVRHPKRSILVLSPYRAQKKAYNAEPTTKRFDNAKCETVHASQGTEADIVILDLVISPGRGKSRFMNERLTPEFVNLVNVAMSRAKHELLIVGHSDYIAQEYKGDLVDRVISHVRDNGTVLMVPENLRTAKLFADAWT